MKLKFITATFLIIFSKLLFSQDYSIKGKVVDSKTGETLPGVVVMIEGTSIVAITDIDGKYELKHLNLGTYSVTFKYVSFKTKSINNIKLVEGKYLASLDISLEADQKELNEVKVTGIVSKESIIGLLLLQKNNAGIADGISSESIKRTPDKSTSDVLKRVSGASIQDNKFVVIRGLNDRYNAAYLNGSPLPSSESDRKAFAFDIFPSNMLENLMIVKTATPDLPAEFVGGIIQINTKNIPDSNFQSFSVGGGYNTITTGKNQIYYKGGKLDWLGIDDGTRAMPGEIPDHENFPLTISEQAALAKKTNIDWKLYDKNFSPNYNAQYSFGYTTPIKGKPLGIIMALTYNKSSNFNETIRRGYAGDGITPSQLEVDYLDKAYSEQLLAGALANLSFKMNDNNLFSFKNIYSINSDDRVIVRSGTPTPLESNPALIKSNVRWFTSNKIYSGQLNAEHYLPKSKIRINWVGALSEIERQIPNLRRTIYSRLDHIDDPSSPNPLDTVYKANVAISNVGPDYGGGIFFSENKEKIYSFKADASYGFNAGKKIKNTVKIGGFLQNRNRDFFARQLGYTRYTVSGGNITFRDSLLYLDDNKIFDNENMGLITPPQGSANGVGGFKLSDGTKLSDAYTASSMLQATYIMLDDKYKIARLVWGARLENFTQKLNALNNDKSKMNLITHKLDVLPSANLILSVTEKQNVRLSYSQTLNRPEYRELAPFAFYDFNTRFVISGDTSLKRAKINNVDVRYEFYPGRGQLLSVSVFNKQFIDPIEQISRPDVTNEISFRNVPKASNWGLEMEFRALLASLFKADSSKFLNSLTAFSNLAIIRSTVDVAKVIGAGDVTRPLQGQSPYVLNAGLQYADNALGMSFSASFNKVGPRIYIVGNVSEPSIWENCRTFLDLQLAKSLWKKRIEIKLNAQNILAKNQIFYQNQDFDHTKAGSIKGFFNSIATGDPQNDNGYNSKEDDLIWSTKFGRVFSLSFSMKF